MKTIPFLAVILLSSILVGCQIEVTPLNTEQFQDIKSEQEGDSGDDTGTGTGTGTDATASTVTLYWSTPLERLNGDALTYSDIGGYEIRYKTPAEDTYSSVVIDDPYADQYSLVDLANAGDYVIEVAVFDTQGIYSDFVVATAN